MLIVIFFVQIWSQKWNNFIDLDVKEGSRLKVKRRTLLANVKSPARG